MIDAGGSGRTPFGVTLAHLAAADPDRPAVTDAERTVTRGELEARSNRLARAFGEAGVTEGSMVTIGLPNSAQLVESVIAAWKLGAVPQPVSHRLPPRELEAIIELAQPSLVVGLECSPDRPSFAAGFEPEDSLSSQPLPARISPSWKAPTSGGSTGVPKLIVSTTPAVTELVAGQSSRLRVVPDGVHLATGPLSHNGPFVFAMGSLLLGCHVVLMRRFDPREALELVERHRVDWMYAVPTMMNRIWKLPDEERLGRDISSLRTVFHMAAPCPPWLKEAWIRWLGPDRVWELYGGTEAQCTTVIGGDQWLTHRGSVGRPVAGELCVAGPAGEQLAPGEVGEVLMRSAPGVQTYRYIGSQPKTVGDWESLGDHGWVDEDGYLYLTGRDSDMVLVGGMNIYPAEIEAALQAHPAVVSACVVGVPDDDLGHRLHALVQVSGDVTESALRDHLASALEPHKIPRTFALGREPLRDEADKVRRSELVAGLRVD